MKTFLKNNWIGIATIAATLFVIGMVVHKTDGGLTRFFRVLGHANPFWITLGFSAVVVYWLLDALSLNILTREIYKGYSYRRSVITGMIGLFYSALTPFAVGGQPIQVYEMTKTGIKGGDAASIVTVKALLFQCVMLSTALISLTTQIISNDPTVDRFWLFTLFGLVCNSAFIAGIVFFCSAPKFTMRFLSRIIRRLAKFRVIKSPDKAIDSLSKQVDLFYLSTRKGVSRKRALAASSLLIFAQLAVFYSVPFLVFKAIAPPSDGAPFLEMFGANALITMITAFVPLPGASGAAEGSFFIFFGMFFPKPSIMPAVVIWRFITYYSVLIAGAVSSAVVLRKKA